LSIVNNSSSGAKYERVQRRCPGVHADGQLCTLQRSLEHWRMGMARSLILAVHGGASPWWLSGVLKSACVTILSLLFWYVCRHRGF
jgi:hypothetical protein